MIFFPFAHVLNFCLSPFSQERCVSPNTGVEWKKRKTGDRKSVSQHRKGKERMPRVMVPGVTTQPTNNITDGSKEAMLDSSGRCLRAKHC